MYVVTGSENWSQLLIQDYEYDINLNFYVIIALLILVIVKITTSINTENFCKFLSLVNFIAYHFGYHIHEKAI